MMLKRQWPTVLSYKKPSKARHQSVIPLGKSLCSLSCSTGCTQGGIFEGRICPDVCIAVGLCMSSHIAQSIHTGLVFKKCGLW